MKDLQSKKVEKECQRTDFANSKWFNQLVQSGQFYKSLTKARETDLPNQTKEVSTMQDTELNSSHAGASRAGGQSTRENIFDEFKSKSVG